MIKKFAMLASMAALFVACSGSNTEAMEQQAKEAEAQAQELLDKAAAEAEAAAAAAAVVDTTAAAVDGAVEAVKEEVAH